MRKLLWMGCLFSFLGYGCSDSPLGIRVYCAPNTPCYFAKLPPEPTVVCSEKTEPPCFRPLSPTADMTAYYSFDQCVETQLYTTPLQKPTCEPAVSQKGIVLSYGGLTEIPDIGQFNFKESFSICFWIQLDEEICSAPSQGLNTTNSVLSKGEICPDGNTKNFQGNSFSLSLGGQYKGKYFSEGCNTLTMYISTGTGNHFEPRVFASHKTPLKPKNFSHFCAVYSYPEKRIHFYIHGEEDSASNVYEKGSTSNYQVISASELGDMKLNQAPLRIGGIKQFCGGVESYKTSEKKVILDELYFYNRLLTQEEILQLYKNGKYATLPIAPMK